MNCRPGDLALVVRASLPVNVGKMVRCIRIDDPPFDRGEALRGQPIWLLDRELTWEFYGTTLRQLPFAPDTSLLPIREPPKELFLPTARICEREDEM